MSWDDVGFYKRPLRIREACEMFTAALEERRQRTEQYRRPVPYRLWDGLNTPNYPYQLGVVGDIAIAISRFVDPEQLTARPPSPGLTRERLNELIGYNLFGVSFEWMPACRMSEIFNAAAVALSYMYVVEDRNRSGVTLYRKGRANIASWDAAGVTTAYQAAADNARAAEVGYMSGGWILSEITITPQYVEVYAAEFFPSAIIVPPLGVTHSGFLYPSLGGNGSINPLFPEMGDLPPEELGNIVTISGGGHSYSVFNNKIGDKDIFPPAPVLDCDTQSYYYSRVYLVGNNLTRCFYDFKYK